MRLLARATTIGFAAVLAIWFAVDFGVNTAVNRAVVQDAIDKAEHWGTYMAAKIPDLDRLVATGVPTQAQQKVIEDVRAVGDIFRFKLFTADGRLSFVSDIRSGAGYAGVAMEADPEPSQVAASGNPIVEVFDGTEKPDRPDLYAEAYVPLLAADGRVRGVIEVYVDQTRTAEYFGDSFHSFAILLVTFCTVIFAVPGAAFYLQRILARRSQRDAEFLARFDPLTGLMNRREFVVQAERLLARDRLTVLCYLDLDRFKTINDTYGHAAGDAFLAHIASVLRNVCRADDLLARFGGDEFVVAFQNMSLEAVTHRVRRILHDCMQEVEVQSTILGGSISIGLAEVERGASLDTTLRNADAALYHAKSAGRNDFAVYGAEMGEELRRRHALETRLRSAVREQEFEVHYQPLVDSQQREIIGYEALLRLSDNDGSPISPGVFIPLAEDLGLIEEIGNWTIRTALREIAMLGGEKTLAINLSSAQFRSGALVDTVRKALKNSGYSACNLELEITESLLLEDSPMVEMQIDALKDMGVCIAMDDFGTGFSSLSYLWKYGFDRLKIDQSFVAALQENSERSRDIIETVIMLGDRLDMKITAEGVETQEQSDLLSSLGCDILQGYLFGKATPVSRLTSDLDEGFDRPGLSAHPERREPPTGAKSKGVG